MKRGFVVLAALLSCAHAWSDDGFHVFTDTQGRTITARVLRYDARSETVSVQLDNGRNGNMPLSQLSDADQQYVHSWVIMDGVGSTSKFKISCDRRTVKSWTREKIGPILYTNGTREENQVLGKQFFDEVGYEITLQNRNDFPLEELIVKYCIYYKQELESGTRDPFSAREGEENQGVLFGSESIGSIEKFGKMEFATKSVVIVKDMMDSRFYNSGALRGEVDGIVLKICLLGPDGDEVLRVFSLPEGAAEKFAWNEQSRPVGENK